MKNLVLILLPRSFMLLMLGAAGLGSLPDIYAASYSSTVLADQPVGYWRLEELNSGDPAADSSATGLYPGAYTGELTMNVPGIDTNSIRLTGSSAVGIGYYAPLNPTTSDNGSGAFSFEIWVRPSSVGTSGAYRCPIGNFSGWGTQQGWYVYQTPDPGSVLTLVLQPGNAFVGSTSYEMSKWYHLAGTYDGATARFYVNGQLRGSAGFPYGSGYAPNASGALKVGERGDGYGGWDGNVDEVAVYTNALTEAQVLAHYMVGTNSFYTPPQAPTFSLQPVDATNYAGTRVQFRARADGFPTQISYQWFKGNQPIPNETNANYSFVCTPADDQTTYRVTAANGVSPFGTSAVVTLTVLTNLEIYVQPTSITRNEGPHSKAAFITLAKGAQPLSYQWYKGTTPVPGATNATLWLSGLSVAADNGSTYSCKVTTPYGISDSEAATLTVQPRPAAVPLTKYAQVVVAADPVGYWRLNEPAGSTTAVDAVGSFDGEYTPAGGTITYGVPTGIPQETDQAVNLTNSPTSTTDGATVRIPYALELNPFGPFSVECWLQPSRLHIDGNDYRTPIASQRSGDGPVGWSVYLTPDDTFVWVLWAGHWSSTWLSATMEPVVANNWYHLALTYDGARFTIYVNGLPKGSVVYSDFVVAGNRPASDAPGPYAHTYDGTGSLTFGWRTDNDWKLYSGGIDEVAIYNKALTPEHVNLHYLNMVKLTITKVGSDVVLSWPFGTLQQADQVDGTYTDMTTATSPYTNAVGLTTKFYRVKTQ